MLQVQCILWHGHRWMLRMLQGIRNYVGTSCGFMAIPNHRMHGTLCSDIMSHTLLCNNRSVNYSLGIESNILHVGHIFKPQPPPSNRKCYWKKYEATKRWSEHTCQLPWLLIDIQLADWLLALIDWQVCNLQTNKMTGRLKTYNQMPYFPF